MLELVLLTMTCFPIRQQNKTSRARAIIRTRDIHTAQSTAMIPEATFIDICQKKHSLCQNMVISQRHGIELTIKKSLYFPFILQNTLALLNNFLKSESSDPIQISFKNLQATYSGCMCPASMSRGKVCLSIQILVPESCVHPKNSH